MQPVDPAPAPAPEVRRDATRLMLASARGEPGASAELLPLVYDELHALARLRMAREPHGHTLQATALVHEAFLRLLGPDGERARWNDRGHFFGAAARAMRRILVEHARKKRSLRHGDAAERIELTDSMALQTSPGEPLDVLALDAALSRLEALEPRKADVVQLRHFAGLTVDETARALDVSPATVKNDWSFARAWLHRELSR